MGDTTQYATAVLAIGLVGLGAVFSNRLTERIRVPAPAVMFVVAAVVVQLHLVPEPRERTVERLVTVALLFILFDGGIHIGWRRFRETAGPVAVAGVVGTFLTVGAAALLLHTGFGLVWFGALLVATAVAPTDPAMVFSVLGKREIEGRSATILEGESGANDPVGIALLTGLLAVGVVNGAAFVQVGLIFVVQMLVGAAFGVAGGKLLVVVIRRLPLPSEALYPVRTLAYVLVLYGVTTLAQGSGFLAVFVAGIVIGDVRAPYKREIERFHSALAGVAEIVVFVVLGLTVRLAVLADPARLGHRSGARAGAHPGDPPGPRRALPGPVRPQAERDGVRAARRAQGCGADPAGGDAAGHRRAPRRAAVRHRRDRRDLLRAGPGDADPDARDAAAAADAHHRAGTLGPRRPAARRAAGRGPLHRHRRVAGGRAESLLAARARGERLDQLPRPRPHRGAHQRGDPAASPATSCSSRPTTRTTTA